MSKFAHLFGGRTDFSIGESLLKPKRLVELAKEAGYQSVAITDTMTISGMVGLVKACKEHDIKPIIGCRLRIVEDPFYRSPPKASGEKPKPNPAWYPKVFVKNAAGLIDLMQLLSRGYQRDRFYKVPRIGIEDLIEFFARGNLALSTGDVYSVFHLDDAADIIEKLWLAHSRSDLFCEVVPIDTPLYDTLNERAFRFASDNGLELMLSRPMLYASEDDADALDALAAITGNTKMDSPWRHIPYVRDFVVVPFQKVAQDATRAGRRAAAEGFDETLAAWLVRRAVIGTAELAARCEYAWERLPVSLPKMISKSDPDAEYEALVRLSKKGWMERLARPTLGYRPSTEDLPIYVERLKYELGVLKRMGFERYFLLVADLVGAAKAAGIRVGPGRGSVGGSLVAYLLGITDVDPIRFGLIFERFINPDRLDLPDADLDFMSSRRHEVAEYLVRRYGSDRVAGITNYATLASASALRDVGRVFGLSQSELSCTKYVPKEHGNSFTLTAAAEAVPEIGRFRDENQRIWGLATRLEGTMRNLGQHAAGIIVAGEPIRNRAALSTRDEEGLPVVNWDRMSVEDFGLIKIDVLGLSTLDMLGGAADYIRERDGVEMDYLGIALNDPKVLAAFSRGETKGVFQFESSGMSKLLRDLAMGGDLAFDDLVAATALYRPGPMQSGLMDDYVAIRQGVKSVGYEHPNMEAALSPTMGVIIYQEQVMQLARDLAGFSMAEADKLRKIMGKKQPEEMAKQRDHWVSGCVAHSGMTERQGGELFDKVDKFAGYGFNKSHSVEYAIISYQAMFMKVYYPEFFYAASLGIADEDKLPGLVADARARGILVAPPDINRSTNRFEVYKATDGSITLYAPFSSAKGLSDKTASAILAAREAGPFVSIADFLKRVNKTKVNIRHQETLGKIGAYASLDSSQLPALHPDRLRDQIELLPGLMTGMVKADRLIKSDKETTGQLVKLIGETRSCEGCSLAGNAHPTPRLGKAAKFMVVMDSPNWSEEQASKMTEGDASQYLRKAVKAAGLTLNDGYFTSLVKSPKFGKQLTTEQINGCSGFLKREVEILHPPVIVAMGGAAIRHFKPDVKGGFAELCGQVHFSSELNASIVFGINPMMVYVDPDKQKMLNEVMEKVAEIVRGL